MTDEAREQSDETVPYRVICISLYHEDIARLDALVKALKRRKVRGVSRSSVIRAAERALIDAEWRRDMDDLRAQMERVRHEAAKDYDESARLRTDNARLDDVARGALDDLARVRAELDVTREALRAHLFCDECEELATRCHAASASFGCDAHGIGDGWRDTTHAAAVRASGRAAR